MKIWIDLTNSPHINFFKPFIKKWEEEGHQIIITARNLANTLDLISQNGWDFNEIGGHAGKNKIKKIIYFPNRVTSLYFFLKKTKPDIAISHSSFYSPVVSRLLRIPSIYLNDNEHAKGNFLAFKFATINLLPEFLSARVKELKWEDKYKIEFYPGIKEGIYLSQEKIEIDKSLQVKIYIRPEPWTAQYYEGNSDFLDPIVEKLKNKYKVVILPRSEEQVIHFKNIRFNGIDVCEKSMFLKEIAKSCILFIGAGGSMTRELAFLGVPTLSVYQGDLLCVDKHLIKNKEMEHNISPKFEDVENIINKKNQTPKNNLLTKKGNDAFELIDKKLKELIN